MLRALMYCFFLTLPIIATASDNLNSPKKVLILRVDQNGLVSDGNQSISSDDLSEYIRDRLFKSYMGTGKMYDSIHLEQTGTPPADAVLEALLKEIRSGQQKALSELCLFKYKTKFEDSGAKRQEKLRKQFPVLFQSAY